MKTPIFNIHDLILILTLAVCLLLAIFQWLLSQQKVIASRLLTGFFLCVGASALANLLLWNEYIHSHFETAKQLLAIGLAVAVIGKSLCLYFYLLAITRQDFTLRPIQALHLLHFAVALGLIFFGQLNSDNLRFVADNQTEATVNITNYLWHYLKLLPVAYALAAAWVIYNYKQQLKEFYSSLSMEGPQWLFLLTLGFALNWAWSLVVHLLGQFTRLSTADSLGIMDNYITFFLLNALFIYSLSYAHQLLETRDKPKDKEVTTTAEPAPDDIERIRAVMEEQQLYLTQNLNIEEFARHVGLHYREVSSIINKHFDTNFFEFVNAYRVDKAKAMLVDPVFAHMTILDILLESGFNSKSAFHRFFKRYTGMSAADFRKQHNATATVKVE
jgi:AraC-like DNA-binding protein